MLLINISIIGEMKIENKDLRLYVIIQVILAYALMFLCIWGLGDMTGNIAKAMICGLSIGNCIMSTTILSVVVRKNKKK